MNFLLKSSSPEIVNSSYYENGEWRIQFNQINGNELNIITSLCEEDDFIELWDLVQIAKSHNIYKLNIFISYFRYSTQEKTSSSGNYPILKSRFNLINAFPNFPLGTNLYFLDFHDGTILEYFSSNIIARNISSFNLVYNLITNLNPITLVSPDVGQFKKLNYWAKNIGVPFSASLKSRNEHGIESEGITNEVTTKNIFIYDDMFRTGQTILNCMNQFQKQNKYNFTIFTTHCNSNTKLVHKLCELDNVSRLITTNSNYNIFNIERHQKLEILDASALFYEHINT